MPEQQDEILNEHLSGAYKYGFISNIESEKAPKGLTEDTIRYISAKKKRARLVARMEVESFSALAENGRTPTLAAFNLSAN